MIKEVSYKYTQRCICACVYIYIYIVCACMCTCIHIYILIILVCIINSHASRKGFACIVPWEMCVRRLLGAYVYNVPSRTHSISLGVEPPA